jgi:peptidoglycan/xylan/chitin deacetylase (PgdA/CDA1 family)
VRALKGSFLIALVLGSLLAGRHYATWLQHESALSKSYLVVTNLDHNIITGVNTGKEKVAVLTFDDGPDPRYTPQVLQILQKYNIKATFFVVGQSCENYPQLIRQQIKEGHQVENHTYTHPNLVKDITISTEEEIVRTEQVLETIGGRRPTCFRPPRGLFTPETIDTAEDRGYQVVLWTICVEHQKSKTAMDMARRIIKAARPGMIILAHDGRLNRSKTIEALPLIIEAYHKMGYRFVTLDELLFYQW